MRRLYDIKTSAKEAMREQRATAIMLLFMLLLAGVVSGLLDAVFLAATGQTGVAYWIVYVAGLIVIYLLCINMLGEYAKICKGEQASVGGMFAGFKVNFWRKFGGMLYISLWLAIWSIPFHIIAYFDLPSIFTVLYIIPFSIFNQI